MAEKEFTPRESLELIRSMIETTKNSISDNSIFFLIWGYATFIGALIQFYLLAVIHYEHHYLAWLITPVAILLHIIFMIKKKKHERVKTFISEASGYVWSIIMFAFFDLFFVFNKIGWQYCFPFYILLYGIGTYITGSLLRFRAMKMGALLCLFLSALAPYLEYSLQILISGLAILVSYIIPGHLLRNQFRKTKNK